MSNLTKLEVLKHRHLSLLKQLEQHGIGARYSQLHGKWEITMMPGNWGIAYTPEEVRNYANAPIDRPRTMAIHPNDKGRLAFKADTPVLSTFAGIPVVQDTSLPIGVIEFRNFAFDDVCRVFSISSHKLWSADENAIRAPLEAVGRTPLYFNECPVNFSGQSNYAHVPEARTIRCIIDGDQVFAMIEGKKYDHLRRAGLLGHLLDALEAAIVSASPAKVD